MIESHGIGPIYWGRETPLETAVGALRQFELPDQRWVTYSWVVEDGPPYRKSIWGFRVKLSRHRALHLGVCRKADGPPHTEMANISPSEIGAWGQQKEGDGNAVPEETTEAS